MTLEKNQGLSFGVEMGSGNEEAQQFGFVHLKFRFPLKCLEINMTSDNE